MLADFFFLSFQNLSRRKIRSYLTMIGIFIGIAAVIALIGLGEGLRAAVTGQFGFLGTDVISITASGLNYAGPPGTGVVNPLSDELYKKLEGINGVDAAINRYLKPGTIEFKDRFGIGYAFSMPDGRNRRIIENQVNAKADKGRLLKDGDGRVVVLGSGFAEKDTFGLSVGDRIKINDIPYTVIGILEKKGSFIFDNIVLINEDILLRDFGDDGSVNTIAIKVRNEKDIPRIKEDLERVLRKERNVKLGEEDFAVQTPEQALEALDSALYAVQLFVTIIAAISLLVGGIGITNTMYTAVLERTKEIGILKSIGARNSSIFGIFFIESGLLGLVGGIIGITIGMSMAYGFASIGRIVLGVDLIQAQISLSLILISLAFSFFIGLISGLTPAIQAAKKNPVDALRFAK